MADEADRPLLDGETRSSGPEPASARTHLPDHPPRTFELSSESTPLLQRHDDELGAYGTEPRAGQSPSGASRTLSPDRASKKRSRVRWPTLVALLLLTVAILAILIFAFAMPAAVKQYAREAAVFKPTALWIDSTTPQGVRARVQGDFVMKSSQVKNKSVRDIGRFATWIAREVETGQSDVEVYLPEYGNVRVGNASVPSIKVNIRNGHTNHIDFLTDLTAGDTRAIHSIAMDWIEGRLGRLRIKGKAILHLKSGLLNLGTQELSDTIVFEENDLPALPDIDVTKLNIRDARQGGAIAVDVSLAAMIDSPFSLTVPALIFEVLVPNCSPGDPSILVASAKTDEVQVRPSQQTHANVAGLIKKLPDELTTTCPGEESSPLDALVSNYIQGRETTIFVRGADAPSPDTPSWIVDLLRSVTVPVPFTSHAMDHLVKNFTMSDMHFSLPDPFAQPGTPAAQPQVSALVKVLIGLPKEMNFRFDVPSVRAVSDVYYKDKELGILNIDKWQKANSTIVEDQDGSSAMLVEFSLKDAPLQVTDNELLADLVQEMLFGSETVELHVAATVDAKVATGLGRFAVRGIPAQGRFPVKTPFGGSTRHLNPRVVSLELANSTESSIWVSTRLNFTNPTTYSATVPFVDLLIRYNGTAVAHVAARNITVVSGNNSGVPIDFAWSPLDTGGADGVEAGRAMLSQYVSGINTTVAIQSHRGSIPTHPNLGQALSILAINISLPRLSLPRSSDGGDSDEDEKKPHFIQDATLHLWSSTADFTLSSPLNETSILITSIDATAFYEKTEPIGRIDYKQPFEVPPGISQTPRLPVDLVLQGVGYEALRRALGQSLQMDAVARVGFRIRNYVDIIVYHGKGIVAKVRV